MLYTLIVKPIFLGALAMVVWVTWRVGDHLDQAARRRHRLVVGIGAVAMALLILGPPAWGALRDRPGEVALWVLGLAIAGAIAWAYARLIVAARRRAHRRRDE